MVSFCNIPLSDIKDHISNYGIGLTNSWARKKGLNPVLYMDKNSMISSDFAGALKDYVIKDKKIENLSIIEESLISILCYMKNYENDLNRKGKTKKDYRFFDEHEWRYIPSKPELDSTPMIIPDRKYKTDKQKADANKLVDSIYLKFSPDDIKYLLIKKEEELPDMLHYIEKLYGKEYSSETIKRLSSRILTVDQIKTDF